MLFSQTAPFGYLDVADDGKGNTTIANTGTLYVNGWAGDYQDFAPVAKVQVFVDGAFVTNATLSLARPDVANVFGPAYLNSGWSASISLTKFGAGNHTVTAVAFNKLNLSTQLTNQKTITVTAPDLAESNVSVTGALVASGSISVTDTVTNVGQLAANSSSTYFYLNTIPAKGGSYLGSRTVPALNAGAGSGPVTTKLTLPVGIGGTYYVVACANATSTVLDGNAANNCAATDQITVAGPDLAVALNTVPASGNSGGTIQVSDTTSNVGAGFAASSFTYFYLNTIAAKGGTYLGSRPVSSMAAGSVSGPTVSTLTLPVNTGGEYFLVACANGTGSVKDSNITNDCASAPITVAGADLTQSFNSVPTLAYSGTIIHLSNTTSNIGAGSAASSYTYFYFNSIAAKGGTYLGGRPVPALDAAKSSGPVVTDVTIPTVATNGTYYLVGCANATGTVLDANAANNCTSSPIDVYVGSKTVIVDPTKAAANYDPSTCGTATAACKSIADGIAIAKAGQTVLVYPGTYVEQVTISKNINLVSAFKNQAVIQAPADVKLAADADNTQTMLTVTGGATNVVVKDMTVAGPIFADSCADNIYGIFVKNANATITGNKVDAIRQSNSGLWGCQPGVAVRFGSLALGYIGHTGSVSNNTISGPAKGGIVVDGTNTNVNVIGNTITGLNVVGVIGQNGIQISRGAKGTVDGNTVSGFTYGSTLADLSAAGILIYNTVGVQVTNNTVSGNDEGIAVYHAPVYVDGSPDFAEQFPTNVTVRYNQAVNNVYLGIHIDPFSTGNTIWNNTVTGNNGGWDELDEHPDFNSNDWGNDPSQYNTIGVAHAGLVFTY
jgi:hypothetical protein